MTFSQPLKLLAIGGSLITTNTLWFFNDKKGDSKEIDENINAYKAVPPLKGWTRKILNDSNFKKSTEEDSLGLKFTYGTSNTPKVLRWREQWVDIDDLEITGNYYATTRKQYLAFPISSIQIKLFDKPVWHDDTSKEEQYKDPISKDQMDQLFRDHDEVKIKQLLYSLQQKKSWIHNWTNESTKTIYYQPWAHYQHNKIDELKDLKIRYFSDFDRFKDYVHKKVESCTEIKQACVAHPDDLDIMETDQKTFFQ